jgi:hypothetical protein
MLRMEEFGDEYDDFVHDQDPPFAERFDLAPA